MSYYSALTFRTGMQVYLADPHSPWQRGSSENTNGLVRQCLPNGTDLSVYSQVELNQIALSLNTRPRKRHQFRTPLEVYKDHLRFTRGECRNDSLTMLRVDIESAMPNMAVGQSPTRCGGDDEAMLFPSTGAS